MQDVPEGFKDNVSSIYLEYVRVWKSFHTAEVCSLVCFNFHQFVAFSQVYTVWKCTVLNFNLFYVFFFFFMTVCLNAYSGSRTLCENDVRLAVSTKCMTESPAHASLNKHGRTSTKWIAGVFGLSWAVRPHKQSVTMSAHVLSEMPGRNTKYSARTEVPRMQNFSDYTRWGSATQHTPCAFAGGTEDSGPCPQL